MPEHRLSHVRDARLFFQRLESGASLPNENRIANFFCMTETPFHVAIPPGLIDTTFQRAITAHRAGHLGDAETEYRLVLALDAKHFDALHMLGIIYAQSGMREEAERFIQDALTINPDHADANFNLGNVQRERGRYEDALASYERALALKPDHADAYINRGIALFELGRYAQALASYDEALMLTPDDAPTHSNRGNALSKLARLDEAFASHERAIALKPDYAEAYSNRGTLLMQLEQPQAALASYERAIALRPKSAQAYFHRGIAHSALKQWDQAVASYDQAIALEPDYSDALANRGGALMQLGLIEAALANFERLIALHPGDAEGHYTRGVALFALERIDDALASFEQAIALEPDLAKARSNVGLLRLLKGDFALGWEKFESRWTNKDLISTKRDLTQPLWLGDADLSGKTILLHSEQGLGDAIQFCRYVPMIATKGAKVILEVSPWLTDLMKTLGGDPEVVGLGGPLPDFELHCPLLSLPLAFKTRMETIPGEVPYLSAHPSYVAKWKARIQPSTGPHIGLVWAGNPKHANDHHRSIGLQSMLPLFSSSGAQFFSLQKNLREGDAEILQNNPKIFQLGNDLETFADTAAIVSILDLVISVDTSVAHLAGALGKPVWILLPFVPDWRWLLEREDSPWYPTARLFRRSRRGDWSEVIEKVAHALSGLSFRS
jgi:tetratricopeptide (TPR) repeat protein